MTNHYHVTSNAPTGVYPAAMEWTDNKKTAWRWARTMNKMGYDVHVTRHTPGDYTNGKTVWEFRLGLTLFAIG